MKLYSLLAFTAAMFTSLPVLGQHLQPVMDKPEFNPDADYFVDVNALNLRFRPSIKSPVLLRLRYQDYVNVVKFVDDQWAEVTVGSRTGYVAHTYLLPMQPPPRPPVEVYPVKVKAE